MSKSTADQTDELSHSIERIALLEKQLVEQRNHFEQVVEEVGNGFWEWRITTDEWYFSPGFHQFLGMNSTELPTDKTAWDQLLNPFDQQTLSDSWDKVKQGDKKTLSYSLRIRPASGEPIYVLLKGKVVAWDANQNPAVFVGVVEEKSNPLNQYHPKKNWKEWLGWVASNVSGAFSVSFDHEYRYTLIESDRSLIPDEIKSWNEKTLYETNDPKKAADLEVIYRDVLSGKYREEVITFANSTYSLQYLPMEDEDNQICRGLIVFIDITHNQGVANQLSSFIEQAPVAMAILDTEMKYIAASQQWMEDYDIDGRDIAGMSYYDLYPDTSQEWREVYRVCLEGEVMRREEDRYLRDDGSEQWIRWEVRPWFRQDQEVGGLMIMTEDITQRKLSELALKRHQHGLKILTAISSNHQLSLEEQLQEVLISVADYFDLPLGIISQVKGDQYTVEYAISREDELLLEIGTRYSFRKTYCSVAYAQEDAIAINHMGDSNYSSHPGYQKMRLETYIGSPIWVAGEKYGTINFTSPERRLMAYTEEDIDFMRLMARWVGTTLERYANEKQLVAARLEAEQATQAKTDFLSTMSHEIRTPMNAVIGMAHLLLEENPRTDQVESLKVLKFSADLLLSLINDILDFNKIEAGKITLESIDFNLKDMMQGIKSAQGFKAQEKQVGMKLRWDDDVPVMVVGDPVRISQIINNLANNAVKFTEQGQVKMEVELEKETSDSVSIRFEVKDTGVGIPEDKLAAIFDEFSQASSSTTRQFGGTGLGLAITKKLLELQESKIQVSSKVGEGSCFYFTLKLGKSKKEASSNRKPAISSSDEYLGSLQGAHVLLVEDNLINQHVASRFIQKWQVTLDTADNGAQALEKVQQCDYDLILMDLQMPLVDGYEATKNIRAWQHENQKPRIPIIALTASATHSVRDMVIEVGMDDFVSKPFVPKELFGRLQQYLSDVSQSLSREGEVTKATPVKVPEIDIPEDKSLSNTAEAESLFNADFFKNLTNGNSDDFLHLFGKYEEMVLQFTNELIGYGTNRDQNILSRSIHRVKATFQLTGADNLHQVLENISQAKDNSKMELVDIALKMCNQLLGELRTYREQNINQQ